MDYEIRTVAGTVEIREHEDKPTTLVGVAPAWDTLSTPGAVWGVDRERFKRGSISNLDDDIVATIEHDNAKIIGRTTAGTLKLSDTKEGLRYEVDLPDTSPARDLAESIKRGDVTGSSFEFFALEEEVEIEDKEVVRTVTSAVLRQVGPVLRPAFADAPEVSLRCQEMVKELKAPKIDAEAARLRAHKLREAELSLAESSLLA